MGLKMSGKKVFTAAGEKLAEFLVLNQETEAEVQALNNVLATINSKEDSVTEQFININNMTKKEIFNFFTEQVKLFLDNLNITNGEKEVHLLDITQEMYNTFKYQKITSEAQFNALNKFLGTKLADIIKTIGALNRSYQVADTNLNKSIANLVYKPLDYFVGGENDRARIYYKFNGAKLLVSNGIVDNQRFFEVFRVESVANAEQTATVLGDTISIGIDDQFTDVVIAKPTKVIGDVTLEDGELIGTAIVSRYGDVAEYYTTDKEHSAGTLMMIDVQGDLEVRINDNTAAFIGVVSDKPGFILNEELKKDVTDTNLCIPEYHNDNLPMNEAKYVAPIVLTGKTPVKVHTTPSAKGVVSKGDVLFPSPLINGVAIAIPFKDSYQFEIDNKTKSFGIALTSSYPKLFLDDNSDTEIQLIYSKIN